MYLTLSKEEKRINDEHIKRIIKVCSDVKILPPAFSKVPHASREHHSGGIIALETILLNSREINIGDLLISEFISSFPYNDEYEETHTWFTKVNKIGEYHLIQVLNNVGKVSLKFEPREKDFSYLKKYPGKNYSKLNHEEKVKFADGIHQEAYDLLGRICRN